MFGDHIPNGCWSTKNELFLFISMLTIEFTAKNENHEKKMSKMNIFPRQIQLISLKVTISMELIFDDFVGISIWIFDLFLVRIMSVTSFVRSSEACQRLR